MIRLFLEGGFAMYPLLALSILTVAISVERFVYLRKARTDTGKFMETINGFLSRNALEEAYQHCESTTGPIASIIRAGLKNQKRGREEVVRAVEDAGALEVAKLEKGILILQTVAKIAPQIGLFGTVIGMIRAFSAMGGGGDSPKMIAAAIAEALTATAAGLGVALPAYFVSFVFVTSIGKSMVEMQQSSIEFLDSLGDLEEKVAERSQRMDTVGGEYLEV
ncbi:MAG TPA: MotA/TolQ/ExbB proton channel family protein [Candidatus Deferrimicrobiaceae bacterium]